VSEACKLARDNLRVSADLHVRRPIVLKRSGVVHEPRVAARPWSAEGDIAQARKGPVRSARRQAQREDEESDDYGQGTWSCHPSQLVLEEDRGLMSTELLSK